MPCPRHPRSPPPPQAARLAPAATQMLKAHSSHSCSSSSSWGDENDDSVRLAQATLFNPGERGFGSASEPKLVKREALFSLAHARRFTPGLSKPKPKPKLNPKPNPNPNIPGVGNPEMTPPPTAPRSDRYKWMHSRTLSTERDQTLLEKSLTAHNEQVMQEKMREGLGL